MSSFNTFGLNSLRRFPDEQETSRAARLAELALNGTLAGAMRAVVLVADPALKVALRMPNPNAGADAVSWGATSQERFPDRATMMPEATAAIMASVDAVLNPEM